MIHFITASICCGHETSMIFKCAMPSKIVPSSLPMCVAPLVRVSKLAAVASIVRSRPCPSLSQPSGDPIASIRSCCPTAIRRSTFQSKNGQNVLIHVLLPSAAKASPMPIMLASATPTFSARRWSTAATPPSSPLVLARSESIDTTLASRANTFMAFVTMSLAANCLPGSSRGRRAASYLMALSRGGTLVVSVRPITCDSESWPPGFPVTWRCISSAAAMSESCRTSPLAYSLRPAWKRLNSSSRSRLRAD